eukprot:3608972-Rhodomonas_salina.2
MRAPGVTKEKIATLFDDAASFPKYARARFSEIKYKKPQFQYNLYQACGFLSLISQFVPPLSRSPTLSLTLPPVCSSPSALRAPYALSGTV